MNKIKLTENIQNIVNSQGYLLIEIVIRGSNNLPVFEIYVDNKEAVTAEDCKKISKKVNEFLESDESIKNFRLDVSSPGVERPLKYIEQYHKHLNRKFQIEFISGEENQKLEAVLTDIKEKDLIFTNKEKEITINFNNIKKAQVLISF